MIRKAAPALMLDLVLVAIFAALGRSSHGESDAVTGVLTTAWPFGVGVLFGWLMAWIFDKHAPVKLADGPTVWVAAVAVGMTLRHLTGRGIAFSFIVVATIVLGVFLLGWRALNAATLRRRAG